VKLIYAVEAVQDLARLREFIAEKDPMAASRVAGELLERIENLRVFPQIGRSVELAPTSGVIRDFVFGSYIVRYALHTGAVVVLRVWHHYENRK
jgi:plasmid stabilization system protein ParE